MDTEALPEFLSDDFLFLSALAGLLVMVQSVLVILFRRTTRRRQGIPAPDRAAATALEGASGKTAKATTFAEVLAVVVHELRQPLQLIVFTGRALKRGLNTSAMNSQQADEMLDAMVQAGLHAGEITQRVLPMTQGEPAPFEIVAVNEVVAEAMHALRRDPMIRRVTVTLQLADDLTPVKGDPVQLTQIVHNLVRNACDAMTELPADERTLVVRTHRGSDGSTCIAVVDSGPGLPPSVQRKLFQPFKTAKPDGMGLGLVICRTIAEAHLGSIAGANNPDGHGAVFTLTLPPTGSA